MKRQALQRFRLLKICEERCAPKNASYSERGENAAEGEWKDIQEKQRSSAVLFSSQLPPPSLSSSRSVMQQPAGAAGKAVWEFIEALRKSETAARRGEESYGLRGTWLHWRSMKPPGRDGRQLSGAVLQQSRPAKCCTLHTDLCFSFRCS